MKILTLFLGFILFNNSPAWALNVMHVKHSSSRDFLGIYHYENLSAINTIQTSLRYSYINSPLYALTPDQNSISKVIITNYQVISMALKTHFFEKLQTEFIIHGVMAKMGKDQIDSLSDSEIISIYPFIKQNDLTLKFGGKVILPTGKSSNYTTGKSIGLGGFFSFEKNDPNYLAILNIGFTFQNKNHYQIVDLSNLIDFSLGYSQIVYQKLKLGFEVNRSITFATDQGQNAGENFILLTHPLHGKSNLQIGFGVEGFTSLEIEKRIGTVKYTHSF